MKVIVDQLRCQAHGRCAATAPGVFELDDDGFNVLRGKGATQVGIGAEASARRGAQSCPEDAIRVSEGRDG